MKIVVGLGNPGRQYAETRHNVGWMVLDRLAERPGGRAAGLRLVKPDTYMNQSGLALRRELARRRVPLDDLLVVVDDFDLPLGRLRLRARGSGGTHNGLRSIVDELGTEDFARLRVGIGTPSRDAIDHVLSRFERGERPLLDAVLDAAAEAVEDWARSGTARAADRWNGWRAADEPARTAGDTKTPAGDPPMPDADGIVRTRTGWRRLLPRRDQ